MRLSDLLTEDLLTEGRKEDAIKLFRTWQSPYQQHATVTQPFQDLEIPKFVEVIFNQDPSGTHKYANWVIKHGIFPYVGNAPFNGIISSAERGDEWDINEDDAVRKIAQTLNYVREFDELLKKNRLTQHFFKKYLSKYNIQQPIMDNPGDINNYDYEDLTSMLRRVGMAEEDIQAQKNLQKSSDDVYNGKYMSVKKPKTEEASCLLGRDTRWCVSSKKGDYFKSYTRKGDLFFFDFSGLMSDLRGKYNKIAYLHKYDDPMGSEWWNAQDDKIGYGDDAWDTMRSGIKAEALLSDEEADEVMEEMKEAYTEIHREHLDGEKEEKYDWLGTKNTAERKYRGIMNHVRSAINAVFGDVKKGIEVDGKKYSKVSENIGTAQKTGKFHWHIKLRDIGNADIMKSHRVSKEELKKIFEYLKEEISKTNLKAVVKYMKDFKIFLGDSGWSGFFVIDTPETIEVNEGLSFANILGEGVFQKRGVCPISQEEEDAIYDRVEKAGEEFQKIYDIMVKKHNVKDTNSPNITPYLYKDKTDQEAFIKIYKEYRAAKKAHKEYEEVYLVNRMERGDDVFTTEDEYYALVRLYKLSPDHFAKPYKSVKDDKGCITGYDVEEVAGETLEKSVNVTPELFAQIEDVVKMMHQRGEAHGDLHGGNIIITDDGKGFKIIDPAGYPPKYKDLSRAIKRDLETIERLKKSILTERLSFANILGEDKDKDGIPDRLDVKGYKQDTDEDPSDNKDLCDEITVNSEKELRDKMRGMSISAEDKKKIEKEIVAMKKYLKDLDVDGDVTNTYMRRIQNMICTFSKEDKENIDESIMADVDLESKKDYYQEQGNQEWLDILERFPEDLQREIVIERPKGDERDIKEVKGWELVKDGPYKVSLESLLKQPENKKSIERTPQEVVDIINDKWDLDIKGGKVYDPNPGRYIEVSNKYKGETAKPSIVINGDVYWGVGRFISALLRGDDYIKIWNIKDNQINESTLSFANILNENRIEDSIKMFDSPKLADTAWYQQLLNIDPSGEHAYLIPLLSLIKKEYPEIFKPGGRMSNKHLYVQDLTDTLGETLKYFHNYKNRFNKETIDKAVKAKYPDSNVAKGAILKQEGNPKDIASYGNLDVFKFLVDSVRQLPSAKEIRDIKKSGSKKIYDDEDYLVVVPETVAASCYYGSGTQWCTAARNSNAFEDYTGRQGVLYYVVDKRANDMKYAIHMTFDQLLSDDFNYANYTIYDEEDNDVEHGKWRSKGDLDTSGAIPMDTIFQRAVNAIEADYEQRASKMEQEIGKSKEKANEWTDADEYMAVKVMMTEEGEKNHGRQNITLYLAVPDDEWDTVNGWVEVDDFLISKMEQVLGMDSVSADDVEEVTIEKTYDTRREYCTDAMKKTSYNQMVCQEEKTYTDREVLDVIGTNMPADTWKEVAAENGYEEIEDGKWILPQLMESTKLSFTNIINEGRVDDAEKFFDEGIYGKIGSNERSWKIPPWFDKLKKIDPSGNQAYLLPILRLIRKGFPSMKGLLSSAENYYIQGRVDELENTLLYFHHNKNRFTSDDTEVELETINRPGMTIEDEDKLIAAPRDIANYWSLHLFNLLVRKMMRHPSAKEKREILKSGVKKIYDDEDHLVVVPETEAASCYYGAGTKWCTAATTNNAFKDYTGDKGVLYYIIHKKSSQGVKNAIQMGFELRADDHDYSTYSVWDEEDKDVTAGLFGKWQSKGDLKTDHIPKHLLSAIESDYEERLNKMKEPEKIDESKLSLTGIILAEGRADDAYQKWVLDYWNDEPVSPNDRTTSRGWTKKAYEELVELDKEAFGGDNKYLDWGLKQFVVNKRSILEIKLVLKDFVKYKDKILPVLKDKDIKLPGVLKDKMDHIRKNPLDINTYGVATLKRMMDVAKTHISKSELKKIIKDEADLIYQDDRFMVVEPHTHRASCHFGMGTKWCTTEKGSDNYFRSHTRGDQRLMYIIDKSKKMFDPETKEGDKLSKVAMHMGDNGQFTFYDAPDNVIKMEEILNDETGLTDKVPLFKSMFKSSLYSIIKKVQEEGGKLEGAIPRGVEIGEGITHIEDDRISFNFGDDLDVLNTYMLFDEYVLDMMRDILSPYGTHEHYDSYQSDEDWEEGYILQSLDDGSRSELKDYLEIVDPPLVKYLEGDDKAARNDENLKELAYLLKSRQVHSDLHDTIVEAYIYAENIAMEVGIEKMLNERLRDLLNSYGFEFEDEWTYRITYGDLIKLYEESPSVNMNMQMLMNWLSEENDGWFGEYELSDTYEHKDYDRFSQELNDEVRRYLENFMGNEEQLEKGSNIADAWLELHKHGINKDTKFDSADGEVIVVRLYDPEGKKFHLDVFTNSEDGNMNKKTEKKLSTSDVVALKTQKELPFPEDKEEEQINELGQSYDGHELGDEFNQAYLKVARVVNSADSIGQLKVARNMLDQLQKKYPKMEITSRDYRFLSGSIIRKVDKLKNIVETYESDDTIRKIAKRLGGDVVVGREDYVYDLWVNEGVREGKKKNFTLTINNDGVLSYETIMDEVILGHVAEGSKILSNKVIDILTESKVSKKVLAEGRLDDVKKKYPKFADHPHLWHTFVHNDPTGNHKYLMWAAKMITNGWDTKKYLTGSVLTVMLKEFYELSKKGLIKNKDINSYKTYRAFADELAAAKNRVSKSELKRQMKDKDIELIYDEDPGVKIYVPKTKEASCFLGVNTKWCTASKTSKNYFDQYTREGFLFYIFAGGSNPRKWALHVDQNGKREFWNAQDMKMDSFDLTEEEEIAVETYMDNHEDEKYDEINKRLKVAVDTAVKHLHIDRTRIGEVIKTSEPYMNFVSYEIRYYPGTEGDVPQWVDVKVFNDSDLKAYVKDFVDTDFAENDAGIILGYQNGHLEDAINKGWFDYDKYMEEEAENDLYDEDGGFLPDSKSQEDILEFIEDEVSMDIVGKYIDMEKIYKSYEDSLELTVPDPIAQVKEGEYTLLLTSP